MRIGKIRVNISEYGFPYIVIMIAAIAATSLATILVLYKRRSPLSTVFETLLNLTYRSVFKPKYG
jgi:hypothetical protein